MPIPFRARQAAAIGAAMKRAKDSNNELEFRELQTELSALATRSATALQGIQATEARQRVQAFPEQFRREGAESQARIRTEQATQAASAAQQNLALQQASQQQIKFQQSQTLIDDINKERQGIDTGNQLAKEALAVSQAVTASAKTDEKTAVGTRGPEGEETQDVRKREQEITGEQLDQTLQKLVITARKLENTKAQGLYEARLYQGLNDLQAESEALALINQITAAGARFDSHGKILGIEQPDDTLKPIDESGVPQNLVQVMNIYNAIKSAEKVARNAILSKEDIAKREIRSREKIEKNRDETSRVIAGLKAAAAGANIVAAAEQERQKFTRQTRNDYLAIEPVKEFVVAQGAFDRLIANATGEDEASDFTFLFSFYKVMDPDSAVLEGEFKNAQAQLRFGISGLFERAWRGLFSGTPLSTKDKHELTQQARNMLENRRSRVKLIETQFVKNIIEPNGLDKNQVFISGITEDIRNFVTPEQYFPGRKDLAARISAMKAQNKADNLAKRPGHLGRELTSREIIDTILLSDKLQPTKGKSTTGGTTNKRGMRLRGIQ